MKIKALYIYGFVSLLVVVGIVLTSVLSTSTSEINDPHAGLNMMPQDDVHQGLNSPGGEQPGKSNVRKEFLERMETLKNSYEENTSDTTVAKEYADFLASAHGQKKAMELFYNILQYDPNRTDILMRLSLLHYQNGEIDKTRELTDKVLKINPDQPEANFNLGALAFEEGNKEKASEIWNDVIKRFPEHRVAQMAKESLQQL